MGGSIGFFYNSAAAFDLAFDGVASGAILCAILPMLKTMSKDSSVELQRLSHLGVFAGFSPGQWW